MNADRVAALVFFGMAIVSTWSIAGDTHYDCSIVSAGKLTEKGTLAAHWTVKPAEGTKFTVDRVTGRVIGGPLDNSKLKIEVIDKGTNEMSFQAFSRSTQKTHTTYIEIQEFLPGLEKPFVGTTTLYQSGVYSGICK
jgi:hypothetical protein